MCEASLGITPEYRKFSSPYDVTFISQVWYPTGRSDHPYFTGPKPGRLLAKLFWTVKPPSPKHYGKWIHSVCQGLLPTCSNIPILRAWLWKHDKECGTKDFDFKGKDKKWFDYLDVHYEAVDADPAVVLEMFCHKYRLNPVVIAQIESRIMTSPKHRGVVVDPILDVVCSHDLSDLADRPVF